MTDQRDRLRDLGDAATREASALKPGVRKLLARLEQKGL